MPGLALLKKTKMLVMLSLIHTCAFALELPMKYFDPNRSDDLSMISGSIQNGTYYSLGGAFACKAYHFGQGSYTLQDTLSERFNIVTFYEPEGTSMSVQAYFYPSRAKEEATKERLAEIFKGFGVSILESADNAEGLQILTEEMVKDDLFYGLVYVDSLLFPENKERTPPHAYAYLAFKHGDKAMLLVYRKKIEKGGVDSARALSAHMKSELLTLKNSLVLGPVPDLCLDNIDPEHFKMTHFNKIDLLLHDLKKEKEAKSTSGQ